MLQPLKSVPFMPAPFFFCKRWENSKKDRVDDQKVFCEDVLS